MNVYPPWSPVVADRRMWSLPQVLAERATTHRGRVYWEFPEEGSTWTFDEVHARTLRLAAGLVTTGGEPGGRLLIMAPNSSSFMFSWFAAACARMIEVPVNSAYHGAMLRHEIVTTQPQQVVVHVDNVEKFVELSHDCRAIDRFWVVGDAACQADAMARLAAAGLSAAPWEDLELDAADWQPPRVEPHDLIAVMFTSGTTGASKGVMTPHAQAHFFAEEMVSCMGMTDDDVVFSVLPLFHGNAQFIAAYPALLVGARFVLRQRFSASQWIDWVRESGATVTNLLGVMTDFIWKQPPRADDADSSLRCVWAVPTPAAIVDHFKQRFGIDAFVSIYGSSEASLPVMTPHDVQPPRGASGLLVDEYFELRIVDPETDEEVPDGEPGEAIVRPKLPWIASTGYYGMPEATNDTRRNMWFHTGDRLRRDADGWYHFEDRIKDALRRRGENISTFDVEQALLRHPQMLECAVAGVPANDEGGEDEVMAWIVMSEDVSPSEIWDFAASVLPDFMVPRYLHLLDELPKTESNKVRKAELRSIGVVAETHDRLAAR